MAKRDDTGEPKSPLKRAEGVTLRERLNKQAGPDFSTTPLAVESSQRIEKLAALKKSEIEEYTAAHSRRRWPFSSLSIHSRRQLVTSALLLLTVGAIAAFLVLAPNAWWTFSATFSAWSSVTDTALRTPAVYGYGAGVGTGLVNGLGKRSEPEEPVEPPPSKRYLLKVITHPPGATLVVADKSIRTPVEMEVTKPEGALRIKLSKESYRSIRRIITEKDFQPEGSTLTCRLNIQLKKQSLKMLPDKQPQVTAPKTTGFTFYLEPMPAFTKP
jgi:hypothetical protein